MRHGRLGGLSGAEVLTPGLFKTWPYRFCSRQPLMEVAGQVRPGRAGPRCLLPGRPRAESAAPAATWTANIQPMTTVSVSTAKWSTRQHLRPHADT